MPMGPDLIDRFHSARVYLSSSIRLNLGCIRRSCMLCIVKGDVLLDSSGP
jgi:hypothetical protein